MKISSTFKVGLLTLISLSILVFTIMWVKGHSISSGKRYTIQFKDVNGLRQGCAVQIMGLRIGQIESITPIIDDEENYVELKFVITEPNIDIPRASTISIQSSGIIGEQFLEISPPKSRIVYIPSTNKYIPQAGDKVQMMLSGSPHEVGYIKSVDTVEASTLSIPVQSSLNTQYAYKISYIIDLPGLIVPDILKGHLSMKDNHTCLYIEPLKKINIPLPPAGLQYTVVNPMRLADFMEIQYKSASSLNETNERIAAILTDDVIQDLKNTAANLNGLVVKTGKTVDRAELLIASSQTELKNITTSINKVANEIYILTSNLNELVEDKSFKTTFIDAADSVNRLSTNINKFLEDDTTAEMIVNLNETIKNTSEISAYLNEFTKDEDVKVDLKASIKKLNCALDEFTTALHSVNEITANDKEKIKETIDEVSKTSKNLRKFSEKLNKRFLLLRLIF